MTSEDYMNSPEWDYEIECIISDMREKLYDMKDSLYTITNDGDVITNDGNVTIINEVIDG